MNNNKKGFTLAELLIVVAIIAVLVLIAIPVFSNSLEKSKEATDLANIRSTYSEVLTGAIADGTNDVVTSNPVALKQGKSEWQSASNVLAKLGTEVGVPTPGGYAIVEYHPEETDKAKAVVFRYTDAAGESQEITAETFAVKDMKNAFLQAVIGDHSGLSYYDGISGSWDSTYKADKMKNVWKYLNDNAEEIGFDSENIKTWSIINPSTSKASVSSLKNDNSCLYYVWSTKDVSEYKANDYMPVFMSHTDSAGKTTYTVGNVKVTNGDSSQTYNVISNGENTVRPNKSGYDIDKLINETGKQTFDNYDDAARYYDSIAND